MVTKHFPSSGFGTHPELMAILVYVMAVTTSSVFIFGLCLADSNTLLISVTVPLCSSQHLSLSFLLHGVCSPALEVGRSFQEWSSPEPSLALLEQKGWPVFGHLLLAPEHNNPGSFPPGWIESCWSSSSKPGGWPCDTIAALEQSFVLRA